MPHVTRVPRDDPGADASSQQGNERIDNVSGTGFGQELADLYVMGSGERNYLASAQSEHQRHLG
jgi:hypothetical protein